MEKRNRTESVLVHKTKRRDRKKQRSAENGGVFVHKKKNKKTFVFVFVFLFCFFVLFFFLLFFSCFFLGGDMSANEGVFSSLFGCFCRTRPAEGFFFFFLLHFLYQNRITTNQNHP